VPNERALAAVDATPRNRLLAIFDSPPADRFRGCPFHNAAVEAADEMPGVHEIVREHKLWFIARLIDVAAELVSTPQSSRDRKFLDGLRKSENAHMTTVKRRK
jgi:hypothetical protein